jgi:hypothetical protein
MKVEKREEMNGLTGCDGKMDEGKAVCLDFLEV